MSSDLAYDFEEQLLNDLHLAQRAVDVPAAVRRSPQRRRLVPLTGAGLTLSGGIAAAVAVLGTGSTPFAGWTPAASAATNTEVSSATHGCAPMLARPGQTSAPDWQLVASEAQGPYTLLVYASGDATATCLSAPGTNLKLVAFGAGADASGSAVVASGPAAPGGVSRSSMGIQPTSIGGRLATVVHGSSSEGSYTIVEGPVASGVTGLSLVRATGETVVTSVRNGWFAAWWPGSDDPMSAAVTTAAGTTSMPVSALPTAQPAGGASNSGAAAGTTGTPGGGPNSSTAATGTSGSTAGSR